MIDMDKTCRTCMKRDVLLVDLFGPLKIENYSSLKLADILMQTIPLQVSNEDGLPQSLCDECVKTLQIVFAFRNRALHSESELKKLIVLNNRIKNEDVDYHYETDFDFFGSEDLSSDDVQSLPDTENKVKIYNCVTCDKKYTDYEKYLRHKSVHDDSSKSHEKSGKTSRRNSLLKESKIKHCETNDIGNDQSGCKPEDFKVEIKLENEEHKCTECSLLFQSRKKLLSHVKEHTSSKSTDQNLITSIQQNSLLEKIGTKLKLKVCKDQFKCLECNLKFKTYRSLLSHLKKHNKDCGYKCNDCGREFSARGSLKRHLLLHSEERSFKCEQCSKCFSRQDALVSHMRKHSDAKKYTCEHCNKAFTQLCALKDHIRTHTGETPFLCSECGKGFKNSSNLRQHLARHAGVKPFSCNLCSKTFCTKGQVNSHMLSHTGVQPYKCNECGSSFTKSTSLKKHKLIHLGLKPFACDSCDMRFTSNDHLKRHQRRHTGEKPYRCPHCARAFTQSYDLAKHARRHFGQNLYQCTICQERFRLMRELRHHYPVHNTGTGSTAVTDKETPVVVLTGSADENVDTNINKTASDAQITITFNRNVFEKDATGDITINIAPEKIN